MSIPRRPTLHNPPVGWRGLASWDDTKDRFNSMGIPWELAIRTVNGWELRGALRRPTSRGPSFVADLPCIASELPSCPKCEELTRTLQKYRKWVKEFVHEGTELARLFGGAEKGVETYAQVIEAIKKMQAKIKSREPKDPPEV